MPDLLFLAHRVPYPPDKGEKIRSYHALLHLAKRFRVHLGCFADNPDDEQYLPQLRDICGGDVRVFPLARRFGLARGLYGLATGASLSEYYFRDSRMTRWVADTMARVRPGNVFLYCSAMAPYAMPYRSAHRVILDMVDVDSEKWRAYAAKAAWPVSALYAREARALLALERGAARAFERTLLVSNAEATVFRRLAPESSGRIGHYDNGVDLRTFDPARAYPNPFAAGTEPVVFTGTMDYRPNIEAVEWFATAIFPQIRAARPSADFWIVGANPARPVSRLASLPSVYVTGRVPDVRPYLAHAACVVAPLKIARGVQNKVLEAMAMAKPVVATPAAAEGISAAPGKELLVAETPQAFAGAVLSVLSVLAGDGAGMGREARARVENDYSWSLNLEVLDRIFNDSAAPLRPRETANLAAGIVS